jgi:negative regulator of flagellin synthesis FlgM
MTERINGQGFRPADTAGTRRADASKRAGSSSSAASSAASAPSTGDQVNLTRSGLLLSKLEEIVSNAPAVDAERVRAIKDALASGNYEIDDQRVADSMLRFDRELLG